MISAALWCAAYLGMLLVVGWGIVAWLAADRSRLEVFGLSACMGPAAAGWWMIAWSLLGHKPSLAVVAALAALAIVSLAFKASCHHRKPKLLTGDEAESWVKILAAAVFLVSACFIGKDALIQPTNEWDAFVTWQLKAKVLASQPLLPRPDYFSDVNLSYSHLRYPILVPIISAGAMSAVGFDRNGLEKSPALLLYFGMAAVVFGALRRERGTRIACLATTLFFALPRLVQLGGTGTAEMALIAFYACSLDSLLVWRRSGSWNALVLTALFSAAMAWSKNEGLMMAAINGVLVALANPDKPRRFRVIATAAFVLILSAIYLAWPLYTRGLPRTDEDYASLLTFQGVYHNLDRVPFIIRRLLGSMANLSQWTLFWPTLMVLQLLTFRHRNDRSALMLWCAIILQMAAVAAAYCVVTSWNLDELLSVSLDRMVLHLTPPAALLVGLLWPERRTTPAAQ